MDIYLYRFLLNRLPNSLHEGRHQGTCNSNVALPLNNARFANVYRSELQQLTSLDIRLYSEYVTLFQGNLFCSIHRSSNTTDRQSTKHIHGQHKEVFRLEGIECIHRSCPGSMILFPENFFQCQGTALCQEQSRSVTYHLIRRRQ